MTKIKINSQRAEVSSEEIKSRRDFNAVLNQYKTVSKPFYKNTYFIAGASLVVAAGIITTLYLKTAPPEKTAEKISDTTTVAQERDFIAPAFPNLDIAYETLSVDASKGGNWKLKSGSIVQIPANAFSGENGETLSGKIDLRYREFRDAVDMLVSGIPMHYDSAGQHRQLESAGMFELLGSQNGKNVSLSKAITVEMASVNPAGNFNQYYLDTTARSWQYLGRDKMLFDKNKNKKQVATDSITQEYASTDDIPDMESPTDPYLTEEQALAQSINALKKEEPVRPTKAKFQNYRFDLDILPEEFPELSDYKGLQFEVSPVNKTFSEKMYSVEWDDVKLNYNTPGKDYRIAFVKDSKISEFIVYPVYLGKDSVKIMAMYQKKFNAYQKKLSEKLVAQKKAKEEWSLQQKKYEEKRIAEEKKYEEERKKYAEEALRRSQAINYGNIRNVFAVSKFGVYNSDAPFTYDNQVSLNISFVDDKNAPLPVDMAYLIDYQKNTLFSHYYANTRGYRFNYNPESKNMLFTVSPKNELWVFKPEEFKTIPPVNGNYVFRMKKNEKVFASVKELKEFLLPDQISKP